MKGIQNTSNSTYRKLMGNGLRYEIPKFQRDYTWENEHWDDLWMDILQLLDNDEEEHYMGYLVLQTSDNKTFLVIDGQQRLTTLSILILAVLKLINGLIEQNIDRDKNSKRLNALRDSYIGYLNPATLISNNKLRLNRNSDDYYREYLVLLKDLPLRNTNSSEKQMRHCFNWYYERIKGRFKKGEDLAGFVDNIVDRLYFTVIEVTDQLNAFKVFETLNARGVQLSASDLLKNYLFSVVDKGKTSNLEINELESIWSKIVGKLGDKKFEDYLRYYWNSYNKVVRKSNLFKTIRKSVVKKEEVFNLVRELSDTADLYMAIQEPEDEFWLELPEVKSFIRELKLFQIKQTNSLLIAGYKNLSKTDFIKLVKYCSIISFRYNVIGGQNPNEQEEVYNKVALNIQDNKRLDVHDLSSVYLDDNSFEQDFSVKQFRSSNRNHRIVKYILSKIEKNKYNNEISSESDIFTIEHILPESADEEWGDFSNEQIFRSIYKLGNLTLLEKKLNREAGTKRFKEKIPFFQKSNSKITQAIPEFYDSWTEAKVSERQKQLSKFAKSIWRIQELSSSN